MKRKIVLMLIIAITLISLIGTALADNYYVCRHDRIYTGSITCPYHLGGIQSTYRSWCYEKEEGTGYIVNQQTNYHLCVYGHEFGYPDDVRCRYNY